MNCADARERIIDRLLDDLSEDQAERLATHLAGCPACRGQAAEAEASWDLLGADPDREAEPARRAGLEALARATLAESTPRRPAARTLQVAAIGGLVALAFASGLGLGGATRPQPAVGDDTYVILVHESEAAFREVPRAELRAAGEAYRAWKRRHRESRELLEAAWLPTDDAVWIDGRAGDVSERRFDDEERALTYYWLIRAANAERALEIARSCPFLRIGARLELRRAKEFDDGSG